MAQALSTIKNSIISYVNILESQGIHVEKAILFGSYASGHPRDDSDIDLVIISPDLDRFSPPERLSFLSRATLHISDPLEVLGYTPEEVKGKEGKSIFWDEICRNSVVAYHSDS